MLDADKIIGGLYVGSEPDPGTEVSQHFDAVVLCAREYQPPARYFPGVTVVHAPFHDGSHFSTKEKRVVEEVSIWVREALNKGKRVLVTCHAGYNRSVLIASMALMLPGEGPTPSCLEGPRVVNLMRAKRSPKALMNPFFEGIVRNLHFCD